MRDVARADDVDAFALRPSGQVLEGQVFAGGAREMGMDVQIGDELHGGTISACLLQLVAQSRQFLPQACVFVLDLVYAIFGLLARLIGLLARLVVGQQTLASCFVEEPQVACFIQEQAQPEQWTNVFWRLAGVRQKSSSVW